jgi:hypothetical protein
LCIAEHYLRPLQSAVLAVLTVLLVFVPAQLIDTRLSIHVQKEIAATAEKKACPAKPQ